MNELLTREASTRSSALIRFGIVLLLWNRFAAEMAPFMTTQPGRLALGASFFCSSVLVLLGLRTQLAALWLGATMVVTVYGFGVYGPMEPWRHHHAWVLAAASVLLALTPCGHSLSVDRWLAVRRARQAGRAPPPERAPVWGLTLIALQVSAVYLWSAVDKATLSFVTGFELERILVYLYTGFRPALPAQLLMVAACATVVLEVLLPIGLFFRRLQPWLVPTGIVLHAVFYVLLPVGPFSLTMVLLYLAYLDPDEVHAEIDALLGSD